MHQIFLGLVGVIEQPLDDVLQIINDVTEAGIRFVYFSAEDDLESKAFATKLNIETGSYNVLKQAPKRVDLLDINRIKCKDAVMADTS